MATTIPIAARSSNGIEIYSGPPSFENVGDFSPVVSKACRIICFSPEGKYLAFINKLQLVIVHTSTWKEVAVVENTKAYHIAFSPKGTYLMTWEPFTVNSANPNGSPNLKLYLSESGELVTSFIHKKQGGWEPQWSADESLFSRIVNSDVVFYENCNFNRIVHRINSYKVASYSLSPTVGAYHVLCHTPGTPGQPSFGRLFKYPNFEGPQAVANKSFFQADTVEFHWNNKGNNALLLTSTEVDKTGGSYYGKHGLHFMGTNGNTSMVTLGKTGPIYNIAWSPKGLEFCVVYGYMPAKATIFNLKCEPVFELGTGPRNSVYYNPHGNILLLGGFGNLRGQIEFWDATKRTIIGKCEAPDTTFLEWCPDGVHILTATTAPRLRIANGCKIWHYTGSLLFEKPCNEQEELYEICWQKLLKSDIKEPVISSAKVEGIASSVPQASKEAYRPPSARNKPLVSFKLHDDDEPAHRPGSDPTPSKAAMKQRKKREARKARKEEEPDSPSNESKSTASSTVQINLTGDLEKDKKLKNLKKKLDAIEKLKEQQAQGKALEVNQLAKIKGEEDLLKELQQLQV